MSKVVPSKQNINFQKSNKSNKDKKSHKKEDGEKKSKWWVEQKVWREMSEEAHTEHLSKKQAYFDSPKGNRVPELNYSQSSQMAAVMQLLAMTESGRAQLCSQVNTLQQLLNSSPQNGTSMLPTLLFPTTMVILHLH